MIRLELVVLLLSTLPLLMALIYTSYVVPRRKDDMTVSLQAAAETTSSVDLHDSETTRTIQVGATRAKENLDSLTSARLLIPALLLSVLYVLGFSLGISALLPGATYTLLYRTLGTLGPSFHTGWLVGPTFAVLGAYTFNIGALVRRAYMSDFSKNVMWACINRLILSVSLAIFLHVVPIAHLALYSTTRNALCFGVAFFPRVVITYLRKLVRKLLGGQNSVPDLDIQLVQGIDVWKEERLEEEGIESVQNMATADIFSLWPKVHFPLRTIVDWMDQAMFIQRFPDTFLQMQKAGFAVSVIRLASIGAQAHPDPALIQSIAIAAGTDLPTMRETLTSLAHDSSIRVLARLRQTGAISE